MPQTKDDMKNGFDEYKRDILNRLNELKSGQQIHTKKIEDLKLQVVKSFGDMETKVAVMKTKVAFITAGLSIGLSVGINLLMKVI